MHMKGDRVMKGRDRGKGEGEERLGDWEGGHRKRIGGVSGRNWGRGGKS